jgi:hypothetical protein
MEGAHYEGVDSQKEAERVCRPTVADSLHFDEEPDPDLVKSRIRIRIKVKRDIRIHIKMMRIGNLEGQHSVEILIKVKREIRIRIPIKMIRTTFC